MHTKPQEFVLPGSTSTKYSAAVGTLLVSVFLIREVAPPHKEIPFMPPHQNCSSMYVRVWCTTHTKMHKPIFCTAYSLVRVLRNRDGPTTYTKFHRDHPSVSKICQNMAPCTQNRNTLLTTKQKASNVHFKNRS